MKIVTVILISLIVTYGSGERTTYKGYQVIEVTPSNKAEVEALRKLHAKGGLDFWNGIREKEGTQIMVSPEQMSGFMKEMADLNLSTKVVMHDVEKTVNEERAGMGRSLGNVKGHWDEYHSYAEIQNFMKKLAKDHPKIASIQLIGKTTEKRDMLVLKVSTGGTGKKGVWVDANIHAREWITPPMVTYIANELVTNSGKHGDLLSRYDFYLLTNVNPDGYEFTRITSRLHRKTRSKQACPPKSLSPKDSREDGVDANRNWGYKWGGPGSIIDPCNNEYNGPRAFSEPENAAIRDFITKTKANWIYYITFHSYGQLFLLPFADGLRPSDYNEIEAKGKIFKKAHIAAGGPEFFLGNWADGLPPTSGTSQDWAKAVAKIKYSITIELTKGPHLFELSPEMIKETIEPVWVGLKAMWLS